MRDFAMFTPEGNALIQGIVLTAQYKKMSWLEVYQMLVNVSQMEGFGEATDTAVREMVYDACGFETNFYV